MFIFHECLYFGEKVKPTLINQNQLRHYGCIVQDNPFDAKNDICIKSHSANDKFINILLFSIGVGTPLKVEY